MSSIPQSKATAVTHEWQLDSLAAASGSNAQIEGDEVAFSTPTATTRKSNVTQINFSGSSVILESFNDNNVTVIIQDAGVGNFVVENAANYRLITANNTATTGSAQANLTFDGSALRVTGSLQTTGAIISNGINVIDNAIAMAIALG